MIDIVMWFDLFGDCCKGDHIGTSSRLLSVFKIWSGNGCGDNRQFELQKLANNFGTLFLLALEKIPIKFLPPCEVYTILPDYLYYLC